jgi:N-formylmaleamate deformylase
VIGGVDQTCGAASGWQTGTVAVTGGQLAYHRTGGAGPVMVLSHGLSDNGLCWSRTVQALCSGYDIVTIDARAHGDSSRMTPGQPHDPARDLAEAIAGLGLEAPIVMGHSMGASAAAGFANRYPGQARKVILEDPPFRPEPGPAAALDFRATFRQQIAQLQALSDAEITAFGQKTAPLWHADEFPAWTLSKRQVDPDAAPDQFPPWRPLIDRITVPTLLIYGEAHLGGMVSAETAGEAMRINPLITAVQIEGAGHNIRRENFAGYLKAVRAFLAAGPEA